jgi:hypothetical protein
VLFTFPSRYLFTIGHQGVFRLRRWSSRIHTEFLGLRATWDPARESYRFHVQGYHLLCRRFPTSSATHTISYSLPDQQLWLNGPATPTTQRLPALTRDRFGLFRFRSPLLAESRLLSLPAGTEMFHFPALPPPALCVQAGATGNYARQVSPFGNPRIKVWLPTPRGLSQVPTSFFGSWCQGIHRVPLSTWQSTDDARVHYSDLKIRAAPDSTTAAHAAEALRSWREKQAHSARSLRTQQRAHPAPQLPHRSVTPRQGRPY